MSTARIFDKSAFALMLVLFLFSACSESQKKKVNTADQFNDSTFDNHSYSNIHRIKTKHLALELDVNFENKTVYGVARHEMTNSGTDTAIFDIKSLDIQKITIGQKGHEKETDFVIGPWDKDSILGQPLMVKIDPKTTFINIYYKTTESTEALDWLSPELTTGKKFPFMYSQGEAILTRSWIPLQDSPANRLTYSATVHVPEGMLPVMSAQNPQETNSDNTYEFKMDQPIPSYLIAIAVGNLSYQKLGTNCGIYAEPELIEACAYEFVDLPKMISAAESLYGKYQWEQYDLIILPYSFPFGGMENPRLTFVNPTVLAGDRSLVSLVAHELAHSWSGNLVTNRSWDDFWLNEGFTVYFENRIMESLYGKEIADILAKIEFQELQDELTFIGESDHPEDTKLKLKLNGRNPDDGMTDIAYIKGAFFLKTIERDLGRERFDVFLRSYFKTYSFKTVNSEIFLDYLKKNLLEPNESDFNAEEWIYKEGIPKNCYAIRSPRMDRVQWLAKRFTKGEDIFNEVKWIKVKGKKKRKKQIIKLDRNKYITQEWQAFIRQLPEDIDPTLMQKLDTELNFRDWGNSEIMCEWYVLGIKAGYTDLRPSIEKFLNKVGRRKYLMPIYTALTKDPENLKWAQQVFERAKGHYHYVSKSSVENLLYK
jgi:aminopeptidase N